MVQVSIGQKYGFDRGVSISIRDGLKLRGGLDLAREVGRSIDQKPSFSLQTNGYRRLGPKRDFAEPCRPAVRAGTIPLGQSPARGGSQETDANGSPPWDSSQPLLGGFLHVSRALATETHDLELRFLPLLFSLRAFHHSC